jgi:L,D-transpeptidase catalytic domain
MSRRSGQLGFFSAALALFGALLVIGVAVWHREGTARPAGGHHARVALASALAGLAALPASPRPAFTPAKATLLRDTKQETRWAPVLHRTVARSRPAPDAPQVALLSATTPEGTTNIVVVEQQTTERERLWARVDLPALPNGTTGWIPRAALGGYQFVPTHLVVDRADLLLTLYRHGHAVMRAPIGIGEPRWPTPAGRFYVREKLTKFSSSFYGPVAMGTNARSAVLTDWPGGGFIGIHGTDRPDLVPGRISHGCIRLRNGDILRLDRLMPVGTPVTIE